MNLSTQMFDRIAGMSGPVTADPQRKATVLPAGCRRVPERRQAARMAYGNRAQICRDGGKGAGTWETVMLQDISQGGVGYLRDDGMQQGETFVVKLTDKAGEPVRIRCKVNRCERGGFGNTAYLIGATFEQVIQQEVLRINNDERDQPLWQDEMAGEPEPALAGSEPRKSRGSVVARFLRAVDPSQWMHRSDDFSSVG